MGDFPYLEWLARRDVTEPGHDWRDYVKAHGLANYCLVVDEREDRRRLVYDIEENWYNGSHPLTFTEHQQLTSQHKQLLQKYRDDTRQEFESLQDKATKFDSSRLFDGENLEKIKSFNSELIVASKACSDGLANVCKNLIVSSVKLLQGVGSQPPCKFAVLGLGSIAKGEATPYSDFEYAFLVERDDEYFTALAVDSYFRLGNLGESPLKTFDIADLKPAGEFLPLVTAHKMKAGLRIDGITRNSGNIPTGNGKENGQSLTLTVDGLMDLYKRSAQAPFDGMAGDKSDMLSSTQVVYTNEGDVSHLYEDFLDARRTYEQNEVKHSVDICKKRLQSFQHDLDAYTFLPEFAEFKPPNNVNVKLKADIFRYPTLLANNIKMCLGLDFCYAWEVYDWLKSEEMLSSETHLYICVVICFSIFMRTNAYLHQKCQTDAVRVNSLDTAFANKFYPVNFNIFVIMGRLLTPLKHQINDCVRRIPEICGSRDSTSGDSSRTSPSLQSSSTHLSIRDVLRIRMDSFKSICIQKDDSLTTAEVLYFAGRYAQAEKLISDKIGGLDLGSFDAFLHQMEIDERTAQKYQQLCGYLLYFTKDYAIANEYFQRLIISEPSHANFWKLLSAHCKEETGDFQSARRLLNEVRSSSKQANETVDELLKSVYGANAVHQDISVSYSNMGTLLCYLSEYKESVQCHKKAVDLAVSILGMETIHPDIAISYNNIGLGYFGLSQYKLAVEYHKKSEEMVKALYGADINHPTIAISCCAIGRAYIRLGEFDVALRYLSKSLKMGEAVYGAESNNLVIAKTLNDIGSVYGWLGELHVSLEYYIKSLEMRRVIYGADSNNREIAQSYNNVGIAHRRLGNMKSALECHLKSLAMKQAIYGAEAKQQEILAGLSNIGVVYQELGENKAALEYFIKALNMAKAIYGADTDHFSISKIYHNFGVTYKNLGSYLMSMKYFNKSLEMLKAVFGADAKHLSIAWRYSDIGEAYHALGDYTLALEYLAKSLQMLKVVCGSEASHPRMAACHCLMGTTYCKLGKHTLGLESSLKSLEMRKAIHGANASNAYIAKSYDSIGSAHLGLGEHTTALHYHNKALEMRKAVHGASKNHGDIADSYNHVGDTYRSMKKHELALTHYTKALEMGKAVYGAEANHPCVAQSLYNIGETYRALGEYTLSRDYFTKSLEMYEWLFGAETTHPDVVECCARLQTVNDKLAGQV